MKWQYPSRIFFAFGFLLACESVHAQLPRRLEKCSPYPTLAHEINELREQTPHTTVEIVGVTFRREPQMPNAIRVHIIRSLKQKSYDANSDSWIREFENAVREAWQDQGYFAVFIRAEPHMVSSEAGRQRVVMDVSMEEGLQYRLGEVRFKGGTVFATEELRRQIPLREGDIFSVLKIRKGIQRLMKLYGTKGYINSTVTPETQVEGNRQRLSLTLELEEGPLFRVGKVTVLGLDPRTKSSLKLRLKPGDPFNSSLVENFFLENKSLLAADASVHLDTEVKRDLRNGTADIVFDFRSCPH